jgi:hypothetical protein
MKLVIFKIIYFYRDISVDKGSSKHWTFTYMIES